MATQSITVDPSQVQAITVDPSQVSAAPTPKPEPYDTWKTYLPHTVKKFQETMDLGNVLRGVDDVGDKLKQGDYGAAWSNFKDLIPGIILHPQDTAAHITQEFMDGNYSRGTADALASLMVLHGGVEGIRGGLPDAARASLSQAGADLSANIANKAGAAKGAVAPYAAGAKAAVPAIVKNLPVIGKPITAATEAFQTAREAVNLRRAQLAEQQATPVSETVSAVNPRFAPAAAEPTTPVSETVSAVNPRYAAPPLPPEVDALQAARIAYNERLIQRQTAAAQQAIDTRTAQQPTPSAPTGEPVPAATPAEQALQAKMDAAREQRLRDQIAQGYGAKSFAALPLGSQATVRELASRVLADEARARTKAPAAPAAAAPVVPPAAAATPTPEATAPATPVSPEAPAPVPTGQNIVSPAEAAPPAPSQVTVQQTPPPSPRTTEHVPPGHVEYYPSGTAAHIPTPGELGHGRYVPEGTEMDSSTLSHIKAENEKAFNAAHYAFSNGITDPSVFDAMSEADKRTFMNGAWEGKGKNATLVEPGALQHGREVGNPTPQTRYQANRETGSILDGHTLRLAKDHLQKMVGDAAGGGTEAPGLPAPPEGTPPGTPPPPGRVQKVLDLIDNGGRQSDEWLRKNGIYDGSSTSANRILDPETVYHLARSVAGDVARQVSTVKQAVERVVNGLRASYDSGTFTPAALNDLRAQLTTHLNNYAQLLRGGQGEEAPSTQSVIDLMRSKQDQAAAKRAG